MKKLVGLLIALGTSAGYADNCDRGAKEIVSQLSGIEKNKLSVLGRVKDDLTFYTFVGDKVDESLVYEVKLDADNACIVTGYYETAMYTYELDSRELKKSSIFYQNGK